MLEWIKKQPPALIIILIVAVVIIFFLCACCLCAGFGALTDKGTVKTSSNSTTATTTTKKPVVEKEPVKTTPKPAPKPVTPKPQDLPLAQQTEATIKSIVKKATGTSLAKAEITQENGYVKVYYASDSLWDENDSVFDTCEKAADIMPVLFKIAGVQSVDVVLETSFKDTYGNSNTEAAVLIGLTKTEADKVNWSGINSGNRAGIINIATSLYIHPAILKNVDNEDILRGFSNYTFKQAQP